MNLPTWGQLVHNFCTIDKNNAYYERFSDRRYNFAASKDNSSCRLIFLKDTLKDPRNKTLIRNGRFIWCRNMKYEGRNKHGFRTISFTIDKGSKRFYTGENNVLCLPSSLCVNNNRFFKSKQKVFLPFSSVFSYEKSVAMMSRNANMDQHKLRDILQTDSPYRPGTLVSPRIGYFHPDINPNKLETEIRSDQIHPCGIILGPSIIENEYVNKEFYRVRFGKTTYEKVHPVQLEIINEV